MCEVEKIVKNDILYPYVFQKNMYEKYFRDYIYIYIDTPKYIAMKILRCVLVLVKPLSE